MDPNRLEIMEKAREKRRRRDEGKSPKNDSHNGSAVSTDAGSAVTEKVVDLVQTTAAKVAILVKSAAHKVIGTAD
jgi:hypothetical protein